MPITLGCVCNFYNEANTLAGFLESHTPFFDHVAFYQSGPGGAESNDGSIEILEKWKMPIHRGKIDDGFGAVRTASVRSSPCDYVMILDADERFHARAQVLTCSGESTPPDEVGQILYEYDRGVLDVDATACPSNWENLHKLGAKLQVSRGEVYDQGAWLRSMLEHRYDAVKTIRRHWHDFSWRRPTQNWHTDPDWQVRIVRNVDTIHWDADVKMHEQLRGAENVYQPNFTHGPFFDHYHLWFKAMEPAQRRHDVMTYDAIHRGEKPPSWEEFVEKSK
jgi:hypothetical protein